MLMRRYSPSLSMWERPLAGSSLFDDVFENFFNLNRSVAAGPRFISRQTEDGWTMAAEVPGLGIDDINVTVDNGILTVSGERKVDEPEGYRVLRRERIPVRFSRSFTLSDRMDGDAIEATLDNGLLMLRIPQRPEAKPRQIAVKIS